MSLKTFFPIRMLTLRSGIAGSAMLIALLTVAITKISDNIWYPFVQLATITIGVMALTTRLKGKSPIFEYISMNPIYSLVLAGVLVFCLTFIQYVVEKREPFTESSISIRRTSISNEFCPPKLDFNFEQGLDTDTERQMPGCISDANELTEEQQLDKIDIYLRDSQESIARITGYLNIAKPDERWMSKKEMDDPNNYNLQK